MTPTLAPDQTTDLLLSDAELQSEFGLLDVTGRVALSDLGHLCIGQGGPTMTLPREAGKHSTTLGLPVSVVVGKGAQEPVGVVVARRRVAGVQHMEPLGDRADTQFVAYARGGDHAGSAVGTVGAVPQAAVWISTQPSGPEPAPVDLGITNLLPVTLQDSLMSTHNTTVALEASLASTDTDDDGDLWS